MREAAGGNVITFCWQVFTDFMMSCNVMAPLDEKALIPSKIFRDLRSALSITPHCPWSLLLETILGTLKSIARSSLREWLAVALLLQPLLQEILFLQTTTE